MSNYWTIRFCWILDNETTNTYKSGCSNDKQNKSTKNKNNRTKQTTNISCFGRLAWQLGVQLFNKSPDAQTMAIICFNNIIIIIRQIINDLHYDQGIWNRPRWSQLLFESRGSRSHFLRQPWIQPWVSFQNLEYSPGWIFIGDADVLRISKTTFRTLNTALGEFSLAMVTSW